MKIINLYAVITITLSSSVLAADYDVVINNGRVIDPLTNFDGIMNVGIKNGPIGVITDKKITAK